MSQTVTAEKILQSQGFGTRKQCQTWIKQGLLKINGEPIFDGKARFATANLSFTFLNQHYDFYEKIYIALNKPQGYECSHQPQRHSSVFELLPDYICQRGVQTVGRLDQDTTGLLLLTDDGTFLHRLTHPKQHIKKYYRIQCEKPIDAEQREKLARGVSLHQEKGIFQALEIQQIDEFSMIFAIEQGVFHQVKRMLHAVGNHVVALHREQMGRLALTDLAIQSGEWTILTASQLALCTD